MRGDYDVLEFIIVPPYAKRATTALERERLEFYLGNRFRAYTFRVAAFAPVGDEDVFNVIPIMNFVDDEGKMRMCAEPRSWVLREIADACHDFDGAAIKTLAA